MSNDYYNSGSFPATGSAATSASMRAELALIATGFDKLPTLTGNANKFVLVNGTGTGLTATDVPPALTVSDAAFFVRDDADATKKFRFETSGLSTATTRVLTLPDADLTLVGTATTQTLTNKTLTAPVISTIYNGGTLTLPSGTDVLVSRDSTDTLTNKTLISPRIGVIVNAGSLTLPSTTDTLVGRATTDTLTNKTLSAAVISGGSINNATVGASTPSTGAFTTLSASDAVTLSSTLAVTSTSTFTGAATLSANPTLSAGTANGVAYLNGSKVLTSGSALVFNGTNLGVGLSPSTWTLGKAVEISVSGNAVHSTTNSVSLLQNAYINTTYKYGASSAAALYSISSGTHSWSIAASGTAGNTISFTTPMTLDATGKLTLTGDAAVGGTLAVTGVATLTANPTLSAGTANGVAYLNGSKVLTSGSALVFNGTNLGVGVSPSSWSGGGAVVEFGAAGSAVWGTTLGTATFQNAYYDGTNYRYSRSAAASMYVIGQGYHDWYVASSGTAGNTISFATVMSLTAGGNLLLGTGSAAWGGVSTREITVTASGTANTFTIGCGTTTSAYKAAIYPNDGGVLFDNNSSARDYVFVKASNTVYATVTGVINNVSDYRLKENVAPLSGALARIAQLNPVRYSMKADVVPAMPWGTEVVDGFLAHEFGEVVPGGVYGEKDAVNADGSVKAQQIDMTRAIPLLVAAVQDQLKMISDLTARIAQLEAAPSA